MRRRRWKQSYHAYENFSLNVLDKFLKKMFSKFSFVCLFLALTLLHICAHLKFSVEAHASVKTINLKTSRKLNLIVGYEYHHTMLWQAIMNTLLFVFGIWLCQREVDRSHRLSADEQLNHVAPFRISAATEVKLNWLRSRSNRSIEWQLFPKRVFAWFSVPWLLTFVLNELSNYALLNLVMRHYCTSQLEVLLLCVRVQLLFLQRFLASLVGPYLLQFTGVLASLTASYANFIDYDAKLYINDD